MTAGPLPELRAVLYGDVPVDQWPASDDLVGEPWDGFVRARQHLANGDQDLAIREWSHIASFTGDESRQILQAWHFLRAVNVHPDESISGEVLGVICEVAMEDSHDVLATYADGSVRYLNHSGASTILDATPPEVAEKAAPVMVAGQVLSDQIGPWTEPALPELPAGSTRFLMLTRGGPRFGQGPADVIQGDALAAPLFAAATELLVAIVNLPH